MIAYKKSSMFCCLGMGRTCVYVHHVDKDAFLKGNIDPDPDELDMVFDLCPSYGELLEQVRKDLNWMDPSDVVEFDGRHNVGFGMHIRWKTMRVNSEQRWLAYKDTVAESLDKALELFAIKTNVPNLLDLNRVASSIVEAIPAPINEEANIEPLSCVDEANEEVNIEHEPLVEANDEHDDDENDGNVLHDNNLGDLDKYNLQETMDHSIPYSRGYASESDDEGPDEGFTAKEAEAFTKVLKRDHRTPLFEDLSLADEAVVDGGEGILFGVRPPSHRDTHGKNIILPGSKFETFFELKMWLDEYSVTHYRPHKVVHSNMKLRYTVACEDRGCPWIVRARPWKGGPGWNIVSCMPHMCQGKRVDGALSSQSHRQLTSEFIAYRLSNSISSLPTMSIKSVQDLVKALFHYEVKYGKAWKAKQAAFKMLYGDWEEAYNRIPRLLGAIAHTNPGMVHVVEPYGEKTRIKNGNRVRVFGRAFWAFEQCVRAFQHCRPVISIDGTFLTGQFKGTLLVAIASDANNRLMPLAFALVEAENNVNWEWFLHILRTKVLPFEREICVISDRHQGILNAVDIVIPGHAPLHHRWCMRHFCANFYRACGSKELADDLQDCCQAFSDKRFARLYNALLVNKKLDAGGLEFLNRHIELRAKWARAYDEDGRRYGQMTSNMAECFNRVLKGVRALPVTAIVQYTFDKLRAYFLKYSQETDDQIAGENKKKYKYQFPPKVDKWMVFQSRKADSQTATLYNNEDWTYEVNEPGGTTNDGQQHGNRAFKVSLSLCDCSCGRPRLLHLACSHLYTAARSRNVDVNHPLTVRESEFSIMTMKHTWAPRFEPYFDQSQWPEYHGVQLWPDPEWKVVKLGRRKTKRFRGDMDGWGHGGGREMGNNQFQEPTERSQCGDCGVTGHNRRRCTARKKKSKNNDSLSCCFLCSFVCYFTNYEL